jgi:type I restriction enzyme M protein
MNNFGEKVSFIWSIAELLRGRFKRGKYQDVILPFTVLRRIDCVLAPTKAKVLARHAKLKGKLENLDPQLRKAELEPMTRRRPPDLQPGRQRPAPGDDRQQFQVLQTGHGQPGFCRGFPGLAVRALPQGKGTSSSGPGWLTGIFTDGPKKRAPRGQRRARAGRLGSARLDIFVYLTVPRGQGGAFTCRGEMWRREGGPCE